MKEGNPGNPKVDKVEKSLSIDNLDISIRLYQFLKNSLGVSILSDLLDKTEEDIKEARGFSSAHFKELQSLLKENNLSLKSNIIEIQKDGWFDDTEKYKEEIRDFISLAKLRNYDHLTEFHLSGMNSKVVEKIYKRSVLPEKVELFYKNDKPQEIHISYDGENTGQSIDFYISGKALNDFFSKNATI